MLQDAEYFNKRIGSLDGAGDTGDYIVNLVREKPVPRSSVATNGSSSSTSSERKSSSNGKEEENGTAANAS